MSRLAKLFYREENVHIHTLYLVPKEAVAPQKGTKPYGFGMFFLDLLLTFLTSGIWLLWIFVREMRK